MRSSTSSSTQPRTRAARPGRRPRRPPGRAGPRRAAPARPGDLAVAAGVPGHAAQVVDDEPAAADQPKGVRGRAGLDHVVGLVEHDRRATAARTARCRRRGGSDRRRSPGGAPAASPAGRARRPTAERSTAMTPVSTPGDRQPLRRPPRSRPRSYGRRAAGPVTAIGVVLGHSSPRVHPAYGHGSPAARRTRREPARCD